MTCTSCGVPSSIETYDNFDWIPKPEQKRGMEMFENDEEDNVEMYAGATPSDKAKVNIARLKAAQAAKAAKATPKLDAIKRATGKKEMFAQEDLEKPKPTGCAVKDSMTNCLYTAQGMFVCQKEVGQKAVVPNSSMAEWGAQGVSKTASPWELPRK